MRGCVTCEESPMTLREDTIWMHIWRDLKQTTHTASKTVNSSFYCRSSAPLTGQWEYLKIDCVQELSAECWSHVYPEDRSSKDMEDWVSTSKEGSLKQPFSFTRRLERQKPIPETIALFPLPLKKSQKDRKVFKSEGWKGELQKPRRLVHYGDRHYKRPKWVCLFTKSCRFRFRDLAEANIYDPLLVILLRGPSWSS